MQVLQLKHKVQQLQPLRLGILAHLLLDKSKVHICFRRYLDTESIRHPWDIEEHIPIILQIAIAADLFTIGLGKLFETQVMII